MKVLVTGGAGFLGSHVTKQLLDRGYDTVVYDNLSRGFEKLVDPRAQFIRGSIAEKEKSIKALEDVDVVIHMAAYIIVPESVEKPDLYFENNVEGSKILLEAMKKAGVEKIVFSSSATVYGNPDNLPLTEESPVKKASNPYGQTKILMEKAIEQEVKSGHLNATILRYFNPYGPDEMHDPETHVIPNLVKAAIDRKPAPVYWNGEQIRDFIFAPDLAEAHVVTVEQKGYHIYNVGTGKGTKVADLIERIGNILGTKIQIKDLGERAGDVPELYTSAEKIKKELGWEAKTTLNQGLQKTIEFFKERK